MHGVRHSSLSALGRLQAHSTAATLMGERFDAFYSSPAGRALETAAAIAREVGYEPVVLEGLREMDFGWMEGRRMLSSNGPGVPAMGKVKQVLRFAAYAVAGERWSRVIRRVGASLELIVSRHPAGRVLIVPHHGTHNALLQLILRQRRIGPAMYSFAPCGITEVEADAVGNGRLIVLNCTDHLDTKAFG